MLTPPNNLRVPNKPTMLMDYKRDAKGNVLTQDGSYLKVDINWNLIRSEDRSFITTLDEIVPVHADGDLKGKPLDE